MTGLVFNMEDESDVELLFEDGELIEETLDKTQVYTQTNESFDAASVDTSTPTDSLLQDTPKEKTTLTVATFNLKLTTDPEDIEWFVKDIVALDVDVAAIQGVVKRAFDPLFRTFKSLGYQYSRFDQLSSVKDRSSAEFLFSKIPIIKKIFKLFVGSHQSRGISKYLVRAGHRSVVPYDVWVTTSQLEIGGSGNGLRKSQLVEVVSELGKDEFSTEAIFAGDTQIPSWQNVSPEYRCPDGWRDAWWEKGTAENEKTSEQDRMDQIWFSRGLECISFGMCCDKQGVVATFRKA